jgi:hypothetical protein
MHIYPPYSIANLVKESELMDAAGKLRKSSCASSIEEAQSFVRRCAEPRPAGDLVKAAIRRASQLLDIPFSRTRDIWYGDARRIDAQEMDRLRQAAFRIEFTNAIAGIETFRNQMLASRSEAARQVAAGLDAALCALGRNVGESGEFKE